MIEVCKALAYAHELENPETDEPLGIVHRDISPPNILISKNGEVKLVDFGLAKANSQIESTDPGVVKGKFSYLSPEAARGLEVDHRADMFAVGIILWEMFTGRRLFYGDTDYQTVELVRQARMPSIRRRTRRSSRSSRRSCARRWRSGTRTATRTRPTSATRWRSICSRGMKVTARDIAELVRQCLEDRRMQSGEGEAEDQHHRPPAAGRDCEVHLGGRRKKGRGRAAAVGGRPGAATRTWNVSAARVGRATSSIRAPGPRNG